MSVGDVDRKRLWGRAGSRCAFCNVELTQVDGVDSIVGDEAHIRSRKAEGPRHEAAFPTVDLDRYVNLILLCKIHHKLVDDNEQVFTTDDLLRLKARHELRVARALDYDATGWIEQPTLTLVSDGTELMSLLARSSVYSLSHDHPRSEEHADAIGSFLEDAKDWGDISGDIGQAGRVRAGMSMHEAMTTLADMGLSVLAGGGAYRVVPGLEVQAVAIAVVYTTGSEVSSENETADG